MSKEKVHPAGRRLLTAAILLVVFAVLFSLAQGSFIDAKALGRYGVWIEWGSAIIWFLLGIWVVRYADRTLRRIVVPRRATDARAWFMVSRVISALGYAFVLIISLYLLRIQVSSILVGGAVTGVIVGIAAQSTLNNLFAGLLLFTLRPFSIGQEVTVRSTAFEVTGKVNDINWYYTVLSDGERQRIVPNSVVIAAVITIHPEHDIVTHQFPVPCSIPFDEVRRVIGGSEEDGILLRIVFFGPDTYMVEATVPTAYDPDRIRAALTQFGGRSELATKPV